MLKQVTEGVWVHNSEFLDSKSIVVQGKVGVLLVDPGITSSEMVNLANDLQGLGQPVIAGFSTHPDWDHVLWHAKFGEVPRYATARNAVSMRKLLMKADWKDRVAEVLPPENADEIPLDDLFGKVIGLPTATEHIPWGGPKIQIIEHQGHADGHAALLVRREGGVLVVGDMLSDILIPFLNLEAADPIKDYITGLDLFESVADDVTVLIPGHGSVGDASELRARIEQDRAYIQALRSGGDSRDSRLLTGPNREWLPGVHKWQLQRIIEKQT